jgi:hypothetical protein
MTRDPLAGETWSRRDFLRGMNAAALAALAAGEPQAVRSAEPLKQPEPTADTLILLTSPTRSTPPPRCGLRRG